MFDLHIYSVNIASGQERSDLPGTVTFAPPKKTARGRSRDYLSVWLSFVGDSDIVAGDIHKILNDFTAHFYATTGSTTYALQSAIHLLNNVLLQKNLKSSQNQKQVMGLLNAIALHDDQLIIAHCGKTNSYLITDTNVHHYYDESGTEKGLGISKTASIQFFREQVSHRDLLLFAPKPPAYWNESTLFGANAQNLDGLRRQLLDQGTSDLQAQTIQFVDGKGQVLRRRLVVAPKPLASAPVESGSAPTGASAAQARIRNVVTPRPADVTPAPTPQSGPLEGSEGDIESEVKPVPTEAAFTTEPLAENPLAEPVNKPAEPNFASSQAGSARQRPKGGLRQALAKAWLAGKKFGNKVDSGVKMLTARVAPKSGKQPRPLSPAMMLFIAISIPVIIVAIATTVYIQRGRSVQHDYFLQQANEVINFANESTDLNIKITYWQAALSFVEQAEDFGSSTDSRALRAIIQQNLDMLGGMSHLEYRPALADNLPGTAVITRIVSPLNDSSNVYLLDASVGRVIRIVRKDQYQYSVDYQFACTPDSVTPAIGALVDMVVLPPNSIEMEAFSTGGASILAVDASGNLLYCAPGKNPISSSLPATGNYWGSITHITLSEGSLYVLDSANRRIWIYSGIEFTYVDPPSPFFDNDVPGKLDDITGMAVNNETLYLLHYDSQMTTCTYSPYKEIKSTTCTDPTQYSDMRTSSSPVNFSLAGVRFIGMAKVDLPDQSLYLMDANTLTLNKFGFQLNLFHTFYLRADPDYPSPSKPLSGFGVTSDQIAFLAFGNQLYVVTLQ